MKCAVCERPVKLHELLCPACLRSYKRTTDKDVTFGATVVWAAQRARRFAMRAKSQLQRNGSPK